MIGRTEGNLNRLFLIVLGALMTALPIRGGEQPLPGEPCTQTAVDCAPQRLMLPRPASPPTRRCMV